MTLSHCFTLKQLSVFTISFRSLSQSYSPRDCINTWKCSTFFFPSLGASTGWHWWFGAAVQQRRPRSTALRHWCRTQHHLREHGKQDGPDRKGWHPKARQGAWGERWWAPQEHHRYRNACTREAPRILFWSFPPKRKWLQIGSSQCVDLKWSDCQKEQSLKLILFKQTRAHVEICKAWGVSEYTESWMGNCCQVYRLCRWGWGLCGPVKQSAAPLMTRGLVTLFPLSHNTEC